MIVCEVQIENNWSMVCALVIPIRILLHVYFIGENLNNYKADELGFSEKGKVFFESNFFLHFSQLTFIIKYYIKIIVTNINKIL